jgi:hypothetical protein
MLQDILVCSEFCSDKFASANDGKEKEAYPILFALREANSRDVAHPFHLLSRSKVSHNVQSRLF